jgi:Flp pilus assembly pilin Flp
MRQFLKRLWVEDEGQNLPEYALLLILVSLTAVSTVGRMAAKVNNICSNASTHMSAPASQPALNGGGLGQSTEIPDNPQSKSKDDKMLKPAH